MYFASLSSKIISFHKTLIHKIFKTRQNAAEHGHDDDDILEDIFDLALFDMIDSFFEDSKSIIHFFRFGVLAHQANTPNFAHSGT